MSWVIFLLLAFGSLNAWLGYLIRYRHEYSLMAGFDIRHVANPERLARWVGGWTIAMGLACVGLAVAMFVLPDYRSWLLQLVAVIVIACVLVVFVGAQWRLNDRR